MTPAATAKKSVQLSGVVVAESAVSSIDPVAGVLMYRGYDIADLAEHSTYEETAYLLLHGELPDAGALEAFTRELAERELPEAIADAVDRSARAASPMDLVRTVASMLPFGAEGAGRTDRDSSLAAATRLIAKLPTAIARHHRRRAGLDPVAPDASLGYAENFLTMITGDRPGTREARIFDIALILHAEHEMNASTFAARVVAGTGADLTAAVVAGIAALSGPLHGGANAAAMALFEEWGSAERTPAAVHEMLERKEKLFGFGHPLYRAYDPRATILKRLSAELSERAGEPNWFAITDAAERTVFEEKGLYPNVDLYSASVYRYLGIPTDLFTPVFAASRVAGQSAHVLEQQSHNRIIRPSATYVGEPRRAYPDAQ
ncbi:MAG TPA: citrate/2-methylcitrate synthase [Gaiellaceae bacterium]|nr:citrate/2-methylcitrate synthase [Gaiellaceae bacterium]